MTDLVHNAMDSSLAVEPCTKKQAQESAGSTAGWEDGLDSDMWAVFSALEVLVVLKQRKCNEKIFYCI